MKTNEDKTEEHSWSRPPPAERIPKLARRKTETPPPRQPSETKRLAKGWTRYEKQPQHPAAGWNRLPNQRRQDERRPDDRRADDKQPQQPAAGWNRHGDPRRPIAPHQDERQKEKHSRVSRTYSRASSHSSRDPSVNHDSAPPNWIQRPKRDGRPENVDYNAFDEQTSRANLEFSLRNWLTLQKQSNEDTKTASEDVKEYAALRREDDNTLSRRHFEKIVKRTKQPWDPLKQQPWIEDPKRYRIQVPNLDRELDYKSDFPCRSRDLRSDEDHKLFLMKRHDLWRTSSMGDAARIAQEAMVVGKYYGNPSPGGTEVSRRVTIIYWTKILEQYMLPMSRPAEEDRTYYSLAIKVPVYALWSMVNGRWRMSRINFELEYWKSEAEVIKNAPELIEIESMEPLMKLMRRYLFAERCVKEVWKKEIHAFTNFVLKYADEEKLYGISAKDMRLYVSYLYEYLREEKWDSI